MNISIQVVISLIIRTFRVDIGSIGISTFGLDTD